jgi:hypothetical protein
VTRRKHFFVWASIGMALSLPVAAHAESEGGWAWAHQLTGSYTPFATYSWSSSGGGIQITHMDTGRYHVHFTGLGQGGTNGGNVQVSAYGSTASCKVSWWNAENGGLTTEVRCFSLSGAPANGQFTVAYTRHSGSTPAKTGYVWQNLLQEIGSPASRWQWHPSGSSITVDSSSTLQEVQMPDVGVGEEPHLLTAYGFDNVHCRIGSIHRVGPVSEHWVLCRDAAGERVHSRFSLASGREPLLAPSLAWTDAGSHEGRWGPTGVSINWVRVGGVHHQNMARGGRTAAGRYWVHFLGILPSDSSIALVGTVDDANQPTAQCRVRRWGWTPAMDGTQVEVECDNASGQGVDAMFTLVLGSTV